MTLRPRYSLRSLLILITLLGLVMGWLALPTLKARAFVAAIEKKDYAAAQKLFINPQNTFPGDWQDHQFFEPGANLKPLTWQDVWRRERNIVVGVAYGDGGGMASYSVEIRATADGLQKGMALP